MKKRSMLAVASLAVGVVASLTAPSAHAETPDRGRTNANALDPAGVLVGLLHSGQQAGPDGGAGHSAKGGAGHAAKGPAKGSGGKGSGGKGSGSHAAKGGAKPAATKQSGAKPAATKQSGAKQSGTKQSGAKQSADHSGKGSQPRR
ncbi:hypothetical protein [Peterkaempfera bronchialis]|uniref:hypothetical protein n=1 Tax=Peterkaempfera bronchialis TaxID=2126346 RepID=UPI003C2B11D9